MSWSYRFVSGSLSSYNNCYGLIRGLDRKYFYVLVGMKGEVLLRTESFAQLPGLDEVLRSLRLNCKNRSSFQRRVGANGTHYALIKSSSGRQLAVSESYATAEMCDAKIDEIMRVGVYAGVEKIERTPHSDVTEPVPHPSEQERAKFRQLRQKFFPHAGQSAG